MKTIKNKDKYYRQSSFPLVNFLFSHGEQVVGINATDRPGQKEFAFISTARLEELVEIYLYGPKDHPDLQVNVRDYEQARRQLLDLLKNNN